MIRLLFKPKWIAGHVLVLLMCAIMALASHWQYSRLQSTKRENRATLSAQAAAPTAITSAPQLDKLKRYQRVSMNGTFDPSQSVYVRYPLLNGAPGYYVLVPLVLADNTTVVVNRGWIPQDTGLKASKAAPGQQPFTMTGLIDHDSGKSKSTSTTKGANPVSTVTAIDPNALATLFGSALSDNFVQLQEPAGEGDPKPLPPPEITEGSHWSYTLQWGSFILITVIGYVVLLRRARADELEALASGDQESAQTQQQ